MTVRTDTLNTNMQAVELIQQDSCNIALSGVLNLDTVVLLKGQVETLLSATSTLSINLEHISFSDSAGVALLLEWLKTAKQSQKELHFCNIPQQMQGIIRVTGLDSVLTQEGNK